MIYLHSKDELISIVMGHYAKWIQNIFMLTRQI